MTQSEELNSNPTSSSSTHKTTAHHPIRVALVEDLPDVRENWTRRINSFPDFKCVCACKDAEEALTILPGLSPDVILMDIFLPRMTGIECLVRLKAKLPEVQIVILTAMDNQALLFTALEAGADGYLLKRMKPAELRRSLLDVMQGGVPMTSQIARLVIESFRKHPKNKDESLNLSPREEEILQFVSKGHSNKLIADKVNISCETVRTHLKRIFKKLHVKSRTEAAMLYLSSKMTAQRPDEQEQ